jgi:hypothetical protein
MDVACIAQGKNENSNNNLVGKTKRKKALRRPKHRWEDNINIGFKSRV